MQDRWEDLAAERFDVLVVGGGVFGCGVAREAALNGLRVALVERDDLASGTSSQSSKMIHGGLRYLENFEFGLVRQALRERQVLAELAPHLVRPCPFLVPVYRGAPRGLLKLRLGLWLYDLMAGLPKRWRRSFPTPAQVTELEPALKTEGLRGTGRFFDWLAYDARLVADVARAARDAGAVIMTHAEALGVRGEVGDFTIDVRNPQDASQSVEVRSRTVVATVGPWCDAFRAAHDPTAAPRTRLSSGVHVVVPQLLRDHAIVVNARSDGRVLFLLPFFGRTLIGTTDRDVTGDPHALTAETRDVDYLLEETNHLLADRRLDRSDVIQAFVGVRTLARNDDDGEPSRTSREQTIFEEPPGVVHVIGGKLTTWRLIARELLERAADRGGLSIDDGTLSRHTPLPGGDETFAMPVDATPDPAVLVRIARETNATSLVDLLRRRTPLLLLHRFDTDELRRLATDVGAALGWSADRIEREVGDATAEQALPWHGERTSAKRRTSRHRSSSSPNSGTR